MQVTTLTACITSGCLCFFLCCLCCCTASPLPQAIGKPTHSKQENFGFHLAQMLIIKDGNQLCSFVGKVFHCAGRSGAGAKWPLSLLVLGSCGCLQERIISVKWFGPLSSVIQVLQSQLIQRAGKRSPRYRSLVASRANLQPISQPCGYTATKGAHSYEQVQHYCLIS